MAIASILNMGAIALNRYIRVVKPAIYSKIFPSRRIAWFYCVLVWLVALFFSTAPLYGWGKFEYHTKFSTCALIWKKHISYVLIVGGGVMNGSTIAIFYCYYKIYKTVKQSTHNICAHNQGKRVTASNAQPTDMKLLKASFIVVCVFEMTWGPVSMAVVIEAAGYNVPREIFATVLYLLFSSSYANPIIYGLMNP
ncbi:melanopsin-B-like, partial [Stylophora pistillata]|uniref:melanopsin-B-like n=1 Tax=Stylophora pistillata TaxID=50429 RepID=UPI000C03F601